MRPIIRAVMSVLSGHLDRLLQRLESLGLYQTSREVRIVEISQISRVSADGTYHVRRDQLRKPVEYESRFDELLATGYSWLNMSPCGVHDGSLIVMIEIPGPRALYPGCFTSVNTSWRTPPDGAEWNVAAVLTIE
jgi:hypothetical protein